MTEVKKKVVTLWWWGGGIRIAKGIREPPGMLGMFYALIWLVVTEVCVRMHEVTELFTYDLCTLLTVCYTSKEGIGGGKLSKLGGSRARI